MTSVLGKRERTSDTSQDLSISSRVKRRVRVPFVNDENTDPNSYPIHRGRDDDGHFELGLEQHAPSIRDPNISATAKSLGDRRRVALSPRKVKGESKVYEEPNDQDVVQLPTPQTPRHRNALSNRVPITPRHRIGLAGKSITPRTPKTPSNASTVYNCARQLFTRSTDPGPLIGRERERKELHNFIKGGIKSKRGRCMYVSGPPGTGKSALVSEVCQDIKSAKGVKTAYINCMSVECSKDIYEKLIKEVVGNNVANERSDVEQLRALFIPEKTSSGFVYVVTLDEIDYLLTLDLEILYTLFEWSLHRSSRLIILGIANALDLTDRFLPRLKARDLKPRLLPFFPYTAPEIASVITTKLQSLSPTDSGIATDYVPFLHPAAIQLCSKKIASQTGDLRKAFDIVRRTVDVIEAETKQKYRSSISIHSPSTSPGRIPLGENPNLCSPPSAVRTLQHSFADLTALTAPRATVAHVSRISAAALSHGTPQRLQTLNLQQKAALCALASHQKTTCADVSSVFATPSKRCAGPTMRTLYKTYCTLCKRDDALHPLTNTEFGDIISGLETLGLVGEHKSGIGLGALSGTPSKKKRGIVEDHRIACFVDVDELKGCLEGVAGRILLGLLSCDN